ncbi:hypothetical protein SAMN04489727_6931 [Amycolatopsis tolypomycina]|uniref:Uncharacterized protein n=1 Tax=Amycolatopsis tolypomycina TaxID=208445 RepID=A0A1H4YUN8_9PSEU|nr:hypothetical protein [Amycolatopsis tolypomycina]SED21712.1 hypothetical protein SAMN04489727_6931 [Amycolatopsis tolypomycina]
MTALPRPGLLWPAITAAAGGGTRGLAGDVAALATLDGVPRLGWVHPPPWTSVRRVLQDYEAVTRATALSVLGTGGWAFSARAAAESATTRRPVQVLDRLDPATFGAGTGGAGAAVIAVSESGRTLETAHLADAARDRWGLDPVWITGEKIAIEPGTPPPAMFGAPTSSPFLVTAMAAFADATEHAYRRFAGIATEIGGWAATTACRVAAQAGDPPTLPSPRAGRSGGLELYTLQAFRQALGGKRTAAGLRIDLTGDHRFPLAATDPPGSALPPPAGLMSRLYAASALVACLGVLFGAAFAEHHAVLQYKRLVGQVRPRPFLVPPGFPATELLRELRCARRPRAVHLVGYERSPERFLAPLARQLRRTTGTWVETHRGSSWNHHSYQAVAADPEIAVLASVPPPGRDALTGLQREIAAATCASLPGRALLIQGDPV